MEFDISHLVVGGTNMHRDTGILAKQCVNFWPQPQQDDESKASYVLEPWPGLTIDSTLTGGDRGLYTHLEELYHVVGQTLYKISAAGGATALGTILGESRCIFSSVGGCLIITADGVAYDWNGTVLTVGTDSDFESPDTVTSINNAAIYDGDNGRFSVSGVGTPLAIDGLDYATAESDGDNLVRPFVFKERILMFGVKTIETWWWSGEGQPPVDRVTGALINVGCVAKHSIAKNDSYVYFLADDNRVYRIRDNQEERVMPAPIVREIANYSKVDDAIGWCAIYQDYNFYFLKFPTAGVTWVYLEGGEWFNLSSDQGNYNGNSYAFAHRKHFISDEIGNLFHLDEDNFTENGNTIFRTVDSAPLHGGLFGFPGKPLFMRSLEIIMKTGIGYRPRLMVSFSDNGGLSFGSEMWLDVGEAGTTRHRLRLQGLGSFESRIIRLHFTDPYYSSIHQVRADFEAGI